MGYFAKTRSISLTAMQTMQRAMSILQCNKIAETAFAREIAYSMIPKKPAADLIRGGYRFPACAKPRKRPSPLVDATAREAKSEKIMLK
jgi:hypothetical protein